MDSKDTKSSHPTATHQEVSAGTDSTLNQPSGERKHERPGENIMKSNDPSTAALRYVYTSLIRIESYRLNVSVSLPTLRIGLLQVIKEATSDHLANLYSAWAQDKQMQVPGSDGSFYLGQMSMGVGAVSGGPVFLPRKEFIVDPPYHGVDHGPVNVVKEEEGGEGEKKKKRDSISELFKKKKKGGEESGLEAEVRKDATKHDRDELIR